MQNIIIITYEELRATITKHVKHYEELQTTEEKKTSLVWTRDKTQWSIEDHPQGTGQGGRKRGRQSKKLADNIAEWIGGSFATTQALAHDRQRFRQLVQRSTVQRPHDPGKG